MEGVGRAKRDRGATGGRAGVGSGGVASSRKGSSGVLPPRKF
jgi:hypothetical protein